MRYISMLRGINVSGQKKIKMAELKAMYEALGFGHVITYIQSGNVIFTTETNVDLILLIGEAIQKQYGFEVPVLLRTTQDFDEIIKSCPFTDLDLEDTGLEQNGTKVLVTFLSSAPSDEDVQSVKKYLSLSETMVVKDKAVYLHCPDGYGKTKASNALLEKKLKVVATTRNWKTVRQLFALAKDLQ